MKILHDMRISKIRVTAIKIKGRGTLGHTRPQDNMIVGPDTLVHIRDWRAKALSIYELIFERQHIVYADGLEVANTAG